MNQNRSRACALLIAATTLFATAGCGGSSQSHARAGVQVDLRVRSASGGPATTAELKQARAILRTRLKALGVPGSAAPLPGGVIRVFVAGGSRAELTGPNGRLLFSVAQLDLYDLVPSLVAPSVDAAGEVFAARNLHTLLTQVRARASGGRPAAYYLFAPAGAASWRRVGGPVESLHRDSAAGIAGLLDSYGGKVPHGDEVLRVPPRTAVVSCSASTATVCPGEAEGLPPSGQTDYYLFKHGRYPGDPYAADGRYPNMTGADLKVSSVRADFDPTTAGPIVTLAFTAHGDKVFHQVTRDEAVRGSHAGLGAECGALCAFAIVLDGQLRSWPAIDPKQFPNGFDPTGTGVEITGIGSAREAKNLALELETGGIPVEWFVGPVRVVR